MAFVAIMTGRQRAVLLQHDEVFDEEGWRMVVKIWKVPKSRTSPEGIDYSLALVSPGGERAVGYDNHWPKGHHRHVLGQESPYAYRGIDRLIADFKADVFKARSGRQ
ncbi:MAG: toxin-antitoxin system TumE family protein [Candidatus Binatia bacterium]